MGKNNTTGRRCSAEEEAAAVRMVRTLRADLATDRGTVRRLANQLCYGVQSVRSWVRQVDIEGGKREGVTSGAATLLTDGQYFPSHYLNTKMGSRLCHYPGKSVAGESPGNCDFASADSFLRFRIKAWSEMWRWPSARYSLSHPKEGAGEIPR